MIYYLQHKGTEVVFFEKKENFMATLEKALKYAETEAEDGFDLNIRVGVIKNIQSYSDEKNKLKEQISDLAKKLQEGRHYLMGVPSDEITVPDALEAFGFGRDGMKL